MGNTRKRMVTRTARITELLSPAGKFGGGWEVVWTRIACLPMSGELIRRDETETFDTAIAAQRFCTDQDAKLVEDDGFARHHAGVATQIEWDPCTGFGESIVRAIT